MRTVHGAAQWTDRLDGAVVSVGNFDGLHRGHGEILRSGLRLAREHGTELIAVTFEPHPLRVVAPDRAPTTLTPLEEKLRCLEACGVDATLVLESEPDLLGLLPREFIERIIIPRVAPSFVVEGRSFGFGRGRSGTVETLAELGREFGFDTVVVAPVEFEHEGERERISSSLVRRLVSSGRISAANECLGRRYALFGTVVHGRGRGRALGFPTANLRIGDQLIPGEGVYSAVAIVGESAEGSFAAAVSVGHTPTFADAGLQVEAHLLECDRELGGTSVRLEFVNWIREQRQFDGPDQLAEQIRRDVRQVGDEVAGLDLSTHASVGRETA